ncbi:MAG: hypothetical protein KZQ73_05630 [Candidatus Thiodiazotropha sp. (ex Semelilucina semeliformis)]|nr:hypothetical protein [Candidatus Thiodiazotropha sp. (ex Semelilucina semeliformis)]
MCDIADFKDLVVAAAAATTATAAVIGLNKWRSELRGRTYLEAYRNILRATYKLREEVRMCRSRLIRAQEFPEDADPNSENREEQLKAYAHVYRNRWNPVREAVVEHETWLTEAEVLWGKEARELGEVIQKLVHELFVSIESYLEDLSVPPEDRDKEFTKSLRKKMHGSPEDEWFQKLVDAIDSFESFLKSNVAKYA